MYRVMEGLGLTATTTPLPGGDRGTRKTVENMRRLADEGSRDLTVRATVIRAIQSAGAAPHNVPAQVAAVFRFVRDRIYFLHDPAGTEWLQSPRATIVMGAGDCDDRATLLAAMLQSFGVRSQFKVAALDPRRPGIFSHVYLVATVSGRPLALDPTYADSVMGFEPPHPYRTALERL